MPEIPHDNAMILEKTGSGLLIASRVVAEVSLIRAKSTEKRMLRAGTTTGISACLSHISGISRWNIALLLWKLLDYHAPRRFPPR